MYEVPISYRGRTYEEGKNIGWRDGLEAIWLIIKFRFFDTRHLESAGHVTLESLAGAPGISRLDARAVREVSGDSVMEAGCGAGNLTRSLVNKGQLTAVDIDPAHVEDACHGMGI